MLKLFYKKIFETKNDEIITSLKKSLIIINALEDELKHISSQELKNTSLQLKQWYIKKSNLQEIVHMGFALIRETSERVLNEKHYNAQILGGLALHKSMITEMKTGEGKTLASALAIYINALNNEGVHVVTVNDYLAQRDANWMAPIYEFHGLSVGYLTSTTPLNKRTQLYQKDILYGTNYEFAFDFLRDNLKHDKNKFVQRRLKFAIIDEVDSVLIDEARTPLVISDISPTKIHLYKKMQQIIPYIANTDYEIDEKNKSISFTDQGMINVEKTLYQYKLIESNTHLYDIENTKIVCHLNQAIKANKLFHINKDYLIKNNTIYIIDDFTGRIMEGRRYSDGLHQAIEAKENLSIQKENQTLASITYQNYFRMYEKLSGMTGTAVTEANEFLDIYGLITVQIPTNIKTQRIDHNDTIYKTNNEKYRAIVKKIKSIHDRGQPVLIGTISIEKSEHISQLLKKEKINHSVLNAKYHSEEANIIAQAGKLNSITIATNMAGRGTDIKLGGNFFNNTCNISNEKRKIIETGGLFIIGTERHESRRIDNQLRGRSGRQGDPGESKFFLSLEDDLMRIFGSDKITPYLNKLGFKQNESIEHPWINKAIITAQQKVECKNYEMRKNLLQFDDVLNDQRNIVYKQRLKIMEELNFYPIVKNKIRIFNSILYNRYISNKSPQKSHAIFQLEKKLHQIYHIKFKVFIANATMINLKNINKTIFQNIANRKKEMGGLIFNEVIKKLFLLNIDSLWKEHLHLLEHIKSSINLRAYGHKEPLSEYKLEAFKLFETMFTEVEESFISQVCQL